MTPARSIRPGRPFDLRLTLGPLRRGRGDPTTRFTTDPAHAGPAMWRSTRTPEGPATTHVAVSDGSVTMRAWGPGAEWCLAGLPALIGHPDEDDDDADADDDDDEPRCRPGHPVVTELARRFPGVRIGRTEAVLEALVPSIIEQKVIGLEAWRSYAALVRRLGSPAPGPLPPEARGLLLPPDPTVLTRTPSWVFHRCGIERKRADTIRLAASYAHRLEETRTLPLDQAYARLTALPGIGAWTAAEVARVALGDVDAVSVGDYHLPNRVAWALAGEPRADDARMLELLEPWRGRRAQVVRLIEVGTPAAPRYGPRLALSPIAAL